MTCGGLRPRTPPGGAPWWHPALTTLIDPVLGPRPVKAAGILIWLLAGWALVRR